MFRPSTPKLAPRPEVTPVSTYREDFLRLEGVWTGTEILDEPDGSREATGRLVFQTVFDSRFLLCDYVQNMRDRAPSVGHAVFRRDDAAKELTVTWFRSPEATPSQQGHGVAEGPKMVFLESIHGRRTRTTYAVAGDKLAIRTESAQRDGEWKSIFEGNYRRR